MKPNLYSALGILLLTAMAGTASAQKQQQRIATYPECGSNATSVIDYDATAPASPNVIEKRAATEKILGTSFTYGGYTSKVASPNVTVNDVFEHTRKFSAQIVGGALVWRQDNADVLPDGTIPDRTNTTSSPFYSKVTLTFTREVENLVFVIQDIDKATLSTMASTGGSDYTDEVDFYPVNGSGQPTSLSASDVRYDISNTTTCQFNSRVIDGRTEVYFRGIGLNGTTTQGNRAGNVIIKFIKPVKAITLTYRNLNTDSQTSIRLQTIGIESIQWCSQADLTTTITRPNAVIAPNSMSSFTATFNNLGDYTTANTAAGVHLPKGLRNVTVTDPGSGATIGTYDAPSGEVTFYSAYINKLAAYGNNFTALIKYQAPNAITTITATSYVTTTTNTNNLQGVDTTPNTATASTQTDGPLPVTLTAFDAKAASADAYLTWTTANEKNNDYFAVERSFDGVSFTAIGKVAGHGTTTAASSYVYADAGVGNKASGTVYYRLQQVDLDGTDTYSPVRTVAFAKGVAAMKLYPNPTANGDDKLTLDLLTLPQGDYQASLVNTIGSTVASYTVHGGEAQPVALPASLAPGTYVMVVQGQGVHLTQRLARQ